MVLEFYYNLMSQPCRAVYFFMKANQIEYEGHKVDLRAGDQKKPEFRKLTPIGKIPIIRDGDYVLTESVAILRYLSQKYMVSEDWYPRTDVQKQARADEFLNWHHMGLRLPIGSLFVTQVNMKTDFGFTPFTKIDYDAEKIKELQEGAKKALSNLDEVFLKGKQFILGDKISVCDLIGACEIVQLYMVSDDTYKANENVNAWLKRIRDEIEPYRDEVKAAMEPVKQFLDSL